MAFQFQCPQGHLLEGDESQAGQHCHCPTCGMLFIIPQPIPVPVATAGDESPAAEVPVFVPGAAASSLPAAAVEPSEPELLHIPCPNGHELETPLEMLDQEVLCPQCNVQFTLRRKHSLEDKRKQELEESLRLEKVGGLWLTWAIVAVVVVVLGLAGLMIASQMNQPTGKQDRPEMTKPGRNA